MTDYATTKKAAGLNQSAHTPLPSRSTQSMSSDYSGWAGWILFGALMMMLIGVSHIIEGLLALFNDEYYLVRSSGLALDMGYTAWGFVQVGVGVVAVLAGISLFAGRVWARVLGTVVAGLSVIANIGFLSAYPLWSAVVIGIDICVILALTVHGTEFAERG
jgi:hypothetical protein